MKKTDFVDRKRNYFYVNTTRKEILEDWNPQRSEPDLIPTSKMTLQESCDFCLSTEVGDYPCVVCGDSLRLAAQDSINAYCGCRG